MYNCIETFSAPAFFTLCCSGTTFNQFLALVHSQKRIGWHYHYACWVYSESFVGLQFSYLLISSAVYVTPVLGVKNLLLLDHEGNRFATRISPSHKSGSARSITVTGRTYMQTKIKLKEHLLPSIAPPFWLLRLVLAWGFVCLLCHVSRSKPVAFV